MVNAVPSMAFSEICSTKVDLEALTQNYKRWNSMYQILEAEKQKLNSDVQICQSQQHIYEDKEKLLHNEISQLTKLTCQLQKSINAMSHLEKENLLLKEKIEEMKYEEEKLKKVHQSEILSKDNERLTDLSLLQNEIVQLKQQHQDELLAVEDINSRLLKEKDEAIEELELSIALHEKETHDKLLRLSLEYETKLAKMQGELAKATRPCKTYATIAANDLFRKKMKHVQNEYEQRISTLSMKIEELQEKLSDTSCVPESPRRHPLSMSARSRN